MYKKFRYQPLSRKIFIVFNTLFLLFLTVCILAPLLKIIFASLSESSFLQGNLKIFNKDLDFSGYKFLWNKKDTDLSIFTLEKYEYYIFRPNFYVSVFTTLATAFIGTFVSGIAAYILMQKEMPGNRLFGRMMLIAALFGGFSIPEFLMYKQLHLLNTHIPVILPLCFNYLNILFLKIYFERLPKDLLDAAEIDGCTPLSKFFKVIVPASKTPLTVVWMFFASSAWNEYLRYYMFISDIRKYNLQNIIRMWFNDDGINIYLGMGASWHQIISSNIVICMIPAVLICLFSVKYFIPAFNDIFRQKN